MKRHCAYCFEELDSLVPWRCQHCGEYFCANHRLPENHSCTHFSPSLWPAKDYVDRGTVPKNISLKDWLQQEQQDVKTEDESKKPEKEYKTYRNEFTENNEKNKIKIKKKKSPISMVVFSIIIIVMLGSVSVVGYYLMDNYHSEMKQEVQTLGNELDETLNNLNSSNVKLTNLESKLVQYQEYLDENNTELEMLITGSDFQLHNPSYSEAVEFIDDDNSENDRLMIENAKKQGIRCSYVETRIIDGAYPLVGFDTIDEGMIYFEPITDYRVFPKIGESYVDCVQDNPYYSLTNDTIVEILIFW